MPFITSLTHGNYTNGNGAVAWEYNVPAGHNPAHPSQTLPPSFYKSAKPAWWGSLPWPAIGPDVTGGTGPGGHTSLKASNPAMACYVGGTKDANGYLVFDPSTCYAGSSGGGGGGTPAPPSSLGAVVH